ncbi:MFS transporter [Crossiella cryophila]|uniref:DHA2 family multidrug resistance protein-like MFS transporter n=1 Tax=Crossiella cryophila TaxID=43355 RepID=A0A7W7FW66_9PSEU|nr:MFS transporter [Crossiella cryophila]MBB4679745.1 DHA2 family multidrug resistance protein-like MFS transporter [Crossiella cryophila]
MHTTTATTPRAGLRDWLGLAVLALPTLLLAMDATVLYLALPQLGADLRPTSTELLWIVDSYGFMIAGFLVTMGTLGDRVGRRRLLLIGAAAFGLASVAAAYASSPAVLIAARALLGIAGATLMPSTLALLSTMFVNPRQRATAIGVWATCFSAGIALGPILGGLLLQWYWWGSVFLAGVPVMLLLLLTGPFLLPEHRSARTQSGRIDLASILLSLAAILPLIYGIKDLARGGDLTRSLPALAVGVLCAVLFIRRQRRLPDPLLDLTLFRTRTFTAALVVLMVGIGVVGAVYLFLSQYLQLVQSLSPLTAGLWLLPAAGAMIVASLLTPALARRFPPGRILALALGVAALGYLLLAFVHPVSGLPLLITGFVLVYLGNGPLMALGPDLIVGNAPVDQAGSAAAMSETSMEFGIAAGVGVLGSIGTAVYRAGLPQDTPGLARDTLSGALTTAAQLPPEAATALLTTARSAFTTALNTLGGLSAVLLIMMAAVVLLLFRKSPP